jgi:exo-beta-1,3-glucanase (GH17 family)
MKRKGILYDVGTVTGINSRPVFDPAIVHRELAIMKNDLHCTAVRIRSKDLGRLAVTAKDALQQGLEVWLSPELWNTSPTHTLDYIVQAATMAAPLHQRYPDHVVFCVGSELTLFMRGIVAGKSMAKRMSHSAFRETIQARKHDEPLRQYLQQATDRVRHVFPGKVTYASLIWEHVDWNLFDIVGVDHYWNERIQDRYLDLLKPLFDYKKPVVITEFGFPSSGAAKGGRPDVGRGKCRCDHPVFALAARGRTVCQTLCEAHGRARRTCASRQSGAAVALAGQCGR